MKAQAAIAPVVKSLELNAPREKAFRHFTDGIGGWWPLHEHSLSKSEAQTVVIEAKRGGRIYEIEKSGREREWGRVLECRPPERLVFSWILESPDKATEIEVKFDDIGGGRSRVTLVHRGWENRSDGAEWRGYYNQGWDGVLASFALGAEA
jgi:uncharacterized protein YndB with AHSA1/START domain